MTRYDHDVEFAGSVDFTSATVTGMPSSTPPHIDSSSTGDGVVTSFGPVNHGLGTSTPTVHVFVDGVLESDGWTATITDADNITVSFGTPPDNGAAITIKVEA